MPTDPDRALSAAIVGHLLSDAGVSALLGNRIHARPPRAPTFPYLAISRSEVRPQTGDAAEGLAHILTLTVVSRFGGPEEARAIVAAVRACLGGPRPSLSDHLLPSLQVSFSDVFRGSDWRYHLGVIRPRAVTEPV